jgi:hypothetical protein
LTLFSLRGHALPPSPRSGPPADVSSRLACKNSICLLILPAQLLVFIFCWLSNS